MIENVRHVPGVCKCKNGEEFSEGLIDRLSGLPDEILLSILWTLTLKEAATTSLLSKRWKHLWRYYPVLKFEDFAAMESMGDITRPIVEGKSKFVAHVNHALKQHMGSTIDELSVIFDLDDSYKSHIDKWVLYAFEKHVKRIELNLEPPWVHEKLQVWYNNITIIYPERVHYTLPYIKSPHNLASLRSLCLRNVNISSDDVQMFLQSCRLLEVLCVARSDFLTSIRSTSGFSLMLERLEIAYCPKLEAIDVCAPKLRSFSYDGKTIKLHITKASFLSEVHIGGERGVVIAPMYESLSTYFPKLKYLSLEMSLVKKLNLEASHVPVLTRVEHLRLFFFSGSFQTLLGWTSLVEACPVLQKLTLEFRPQGLVKSPKPPALKSCGRPLRYLRTLELVDFIGWKNDLELAYFVLENAISLQEVIVDLRPRPYINYSEGAQQRLKLLQNKIPEGVKLIIKETYPAPPPPFP
ncbi:hypothetical protein RND81_01G055500 [Saponaria officinalis]|uniref:F-box domain-containing protein n=1 Tax=Saponaria officinalis TaxID=3572 RepID=A0AAW1N5X1_SAPOF